MDFEREELLYRLYKKGRSKLANSDKLLLEANPDLKKDLFAMFDEKEKLDNRKGNKILTFFRSPPLIAIGSVAACLLITFLFVLPRLSPSPIPLGGKVSLFISNINSPNRFYKSGSQYSPGEIIRIAFQPALNGAAIRQGVIISFGSPGSLVVHYRYDSQKNQLDERKRIIIEENYTLTGGNDYFYLLAYFSPDSFNEQKRIEDILEIINLKGINAEGFLNKKYKNDSIDIIYLEKAN